MAISYKKAMGIIADKKKSGEVFTITDKIKKCQELMVISYETMLDFIKKDFNQIIRIYVLLFSKTEKKWHYQTTKSLTLQQVICWILI